MKIKYLSLLIAVLGGSLSFGASINNLDPAYSKDYTIYDGSNGDTLNVSSPTTVSVNGATSWTMAFTISGLATTSGTDVGLLFTCNTTSSNYKNLEGMGYQLTEGGDLTLCAGGYNYNGGTAGTSPWKTQTLSGYSAEQPLTLFYSYNNGNITISAMLGNDTSSLTTLASISGTGVKFGSSIINQLNFSAKDGSGNTWSAPNGVTGEYTLNNFDLYMGGLTEDQMKEYALSAVPEPAAASLGLLGVGMLLIRRRRA
ncbi:MAG: hypothetical protein KHX31_10680 [Akkermansia sp.]|uniref:hypothetical protein n=1 Tax=Akkermansia sp. TaxID=1872421 RepID=UPI0025C5AC4C|nr:hypothetical protein [Akkermansia sp.]MBS5509089.1 hypothetical protein [Akkermansia sp.]